MSASNFTGAICQLVQMNLSMSDAARKFLVFFFGAGGGFLFFFSPPPGSSKVEENHVLLMNAVSIGCMDRWIDR